MAFFGSSLVSAYWNGAATYYRGMIRGLHALGYDVTFYEPNAYERQEHRDIADPSWARVVVYDNSADGLASALDDARTADVVVKASGVGVFDRELEDTISRWPGSALRIFWDVDAPATLDRLDANPVDPFHAQIPRFDMVLTYGGGEPVRQAYLARHARACVPIYNALDPSTHYPVAPDARFTADLGFLGNRLPDREARVEEFFLRPAAQLPALRFLLGGNGWDARPRSENVHCTGHVYTVDHNAFNCTPRAVLNISRDSMARYGFSPATRVFEAAGAGACLITDAWEGVETFLEPEREALVARNGDEVGAVIRDLKPGTALAIGEAARRRVLAEHTYSHRAAHVAALLEGRMASA